MNINIFIYKLTNNTNVPDNKSTTHAEQQG